ncbi:MAG TPA: hypothetical protein VGK00_10360 [Anaerolineales bacterium]|jgi:hypothetical protein
MTEDNNAPKKKIFSDITLSESLLLAVIPIIAYLFTFIYQAGYLQAFELPIQFVSISIVDVFNIGGKIIAILLGFFMVINYGVLFFSAQGKIIPILESRVITVAMLFLYLYPNLFLFEWGIGTIIAIIAFFTSLALLFLPPLLTKKYQGTYLQKMEMLDKRPESTKISNPTLFESAAQFIGYRGFVMVIALLLILNLTFNAGKAEALNQKIFYIANTSPETIILFSTGDKIISAPFNKNTKIIEPEFSIINVNNSSSLKLRPVYTGPLKINNLSLTPIPAPTNTQIPTHTPSHTPTVTSQ